MFFPHLYQQGQSPALSSETRTLIYDNCLRPAVLAVNPFDQSRWPITYSAATTLYRDDKGRFHFGTMDLPSHILGKFCDKLLELFQQHADLRDAFFLHEIRGTKSESHHQLNEKERCLALDGVLHRFDRLKMNPDNWFIDVGLEVRHEGHVLQWLTSGHRQILAFLLPSASADQIGAVLKSPSKYFCDLSAQLRDLGGFRAIPGPQGRLDRIAYMNVYTTDKSATYQLHQGVFKRRKGWHLFSGTIGQLLRDLKSIAHTFQICGDPNVAGGHEGNARMEIRVPLCLVDKVLLELPERLVENAIISFECSTFW